ncbi:MAG: cryptochrome/photolyase family protein [Anderseniella sp.]
MNLILILGDQLTPNISSLRNADIDSDIVIMAEVMSEVLMILPPVCIYQNSI